MGIYDYNDIRNQDWYNRLVRNLQERTTAAIRRTGSEVNDPYWRAKEREGLSELTNARQDAFRRAFAAARERQAAAGSRMRGQEEGRQRTISSALRAQWRPDVGLGTMPQDGMPAGLGAAAPEPIMMSPEQPAEAYPRPAVPSIYARDRSAAPGAGVYTNRNWAAGQAARGGFAPARAAGVYAGYNPSVFQDPNLKYRKKKLDDVYDNLVRRWP